MKIGLGLSLTSNRGRRIFSPLSLSPVVWYDPSDLSTMFQTTDESTPVTADSDPVGRINDKSGNGYNFLQTTAASRPLYKTSGGLHWLEFDGVDDGLSASGITWVDDAATCVGLRPGVDDKFILGSGASSSKFWFGTADSATTKMHNFPSQITTRVDGAALAAATTRAQMLAALPNNTNKIVMFEAMKFLTEWTTDIFNFSGYATWEFTGRLYGYIITPALSTANRTALETYMATKSGVTL